MSISTKLVKAAMLLFSTIITSLAFSYIFLGLESDLTKKLLDIFSVCVLGIIAGVFLMLALEKE